MGRQAKTLSTPEWRRFEELVAEIERQLAPGAVVTSPDRIRDLLTGRLREVDASIRLTLGSTPILITVECRKRRGVQDDTWIEQLATKKAKVGAAKTIAVSESGFSASAERTAALHGIELRRLVDRAAEDIVRHLLDGITVTLTFGNYKVISVTFSTPDDLTSLRDLDKRLSPMVESQGLGNIVGQVLTSAGTSFRDILGRADDADVPVNGAAVRKDLNISFPQAVQLDTPDGAVHINGLQFVIDFTRRSMEAPATAFHEYSSPEGVIRRMIEANTPAEDGEAWRVFLVVEAPDLDNSKDSPAA
jgi:hypothetical protein